jgi:hypothetical protein
VKSILDKSFVYINSAKTDVKATFERVRKRLREEEKARAAEQMLVAEEQKVKVRRIKKD